MNYSYTCMEISGLKLNYFGLDFIATTRETAGCYFLAQTVVPANDYGPPLHVHTMEDEGFYILSGELNFIVESKEFHLKEGEFISIMKGERHSWYNSSNIEVKLLIIFTPAGIEEMFKELHHDPENIVEIGRRYGTEFYL